MNMLRLAGRWAAATTACALSGGVIANDGLAWRADAWLWPQVQARITLSTAALSPVSLVRGGEGAARGVLGGALWGDYVFVTPGLGSLRASSALLLGNPGAPLASLTGARRLWITAMDSGSSGNGANETPLAAPYLGVGYNTPLAWRSLSLSADLGLVAERPGGIPGFGRALFGSGGLDTAWREMRVAPLVQLSVRYSF
jgi:hypothetical protein